jgi:hypothetical protein
MSSRTWSRWSTITGTAECLGEQVGEVAGSGQLGEVVIVQLPVAGDHCRLISIQLGLAVG